MLINFWKMYKFIKGGTDILGGLIIIIIVTPLLLIISVLLIFSYKGNPFFTQERPGKDAKVFKLIKFKTMNDKRDSKGNLLPDSERITSIGRFLRKYSLDELPQFFNVLRGDMSLVGPRPLLVKYLPLYNDRQAKRHLVKPGITGLAQVSGRNNLSWEEKFELDVYYVENVSFLMDVKILLKTLYKVFKREGINYSYSVNMQPFKGENKI